MTNISWHTLCVRWIPCKTTACNGAHLDLAVISGAAVEPSTRPPRCLCRCSRRCRLFAAHNCNKLCCGP